MFTGLLFGRLAPRLMPPHFFHRSVRIEYDTAVRADTSKQNYGVSPRYWYIDALFRCRSCGRIFCFTAREQRVWYEQYGFYVDSIPKHCEACRRAMRHIDALRHTYDLEIAAALEGDDGDHKQRMIMLIDELYEAGADLPPKIHENRRILARQVARRHPAAG